jgi:energy-coupling factor transport system permease protein
MENKKTLPSAFALYHPVVNFLWFALVLVCTMFFLHPLCLGISLVCAIGYAFKLNGQKAMRFSLRVLLPILVLTALLNPAFNHAGVTRLFYLSSGNAVTLESIIYGLAAATMLVAVISWFSCYNVIMTSDKFVYLFGKIIPSLSLIVAIVLRLVPRFRTEAKAIISAQAGFSQMSEKNLMQKIKQALLIVSILLTWALENCIDTADSMKARGYGLPRRSAFSLYRLESRDKLMLLILTLLGGLVIVAAVSGAFAYQYFPSIKIPAPTLGSAVMFFAYLLLSALPLIIDFMEDYRWKLSLYQS